MKVPMQSSWAVRKIIGAREHLKKLQNGKYWIQNATFSIKHLYNTFMGRPQKVPWAKMVCQNAAPPKCLFITWLVLHERLATCSHLQRIGVLVDYVCCLCRIVDETLDHLFFECDVGRRVWT